LSIVVLSDTLWALVHHQEPYETFPHIFRYILLVLILSRALGSFHNHFVMRQTVGTIDLSMCPAKFAKNNYRLRYSQIPTNKLPVLPNGLSGHKKVTRYDTRLIDIYTVSVDKRKSKHCIMTQRASSLSLLLLLLLLLLLVTTALAVVIVDVAAVSVEEDADAVDGSLSSSSSSTTVTAILEGERDRISREGNNNNNINNNSVRRQELPSSFHEMMSPTMMVLQQRQQQPNENDLWDNDVHLHHQGRQLQLDVGTIFPTVSPTTSSSSSSSSSNSINNNTTADDAAGTVITLQFLFGFTMWYNPTATATATTTSSSEFVSDNNNDDVLNYLQTETINYLSSYVQNQTSSIEISSVTNQVVGTMDCYLYFDSFSSN
jgi:hypothetical protein